MKLKAVNIYPVKSMGAVPQTEAQTDQRGLIGDRRWMLVNRSGRFLTQRAHPEMALIHPRLTERGLVLSKAGMPDLEVPIPDGVAREKVTVFQDEVDALPVRKAEAWIREALGLDAHLVYMDDSAKREIRTKFREASGPVSFADAMPISIISEASLADLESRLGEDLDGLRFRPNLVVEGVDSFAEDQWKRIRIGEIELEVSCRIARCILTTVNPRTGVKHPQEEPFRTLKSYRPLSPTGSPYFAVAAVSLNQGSLRVGDSIQVL